MAMIGVVNSQEMHTLRASTHHSEEASQEDMAYVACRGPACMRLAGLEEAYRASCAKKRDRQKRK